MGGILSGAMRGIGEAGLDLTKRAADYLARSEFQSEAAGVQKLRDERLAELAEQAAVRADERKRAPAIAAAADIEAGKGAMVDDASGTVRPRTRAEQAEFESGAYRKRGMIREALSIEDREFRKDEAGKADLARTRDDNRADTQLEEQKRHNKASEGIQVAAARRAQSLLDLKIKGMGLNGKQSTALTTNIDFMVRNGIAKDPAEAFSMMRTQMERSPTKAVEQLTMQLLKSGDRRYSGKAGQLIAITDAKAILGKIRDADDASLETGSDRGASVGAQGRRPLESFFGD